mgnify:CR=1 FL=1
MRPAAACRVPPRPAAVHLCAPPAARGDGTHSRHLPTAAGDAGCVGREAGRRDQGEAWDTKNKPKHKVI